LIDLGGTDKRRALDPAVRDVETWHAEGIPAGLDVLAAVRRNSTSRGTPSDAGDTVIMQADAPQQITAQRGQRVRRRRGRPREHEDLPRRPEYGVPAAAALDGDRILPKWIA
jgi:hypothetical protein